MKIKLDRPRLAWYVATKKLSQLPKIIKERTPQIISDEICRPAQGDVFAIVVKYVKFGLSADFLALLDSLSAASVNTIVVCNGAPDAQMKALLAAKVHRIIVRRNIGRDFGAYRAATLHLAAQGFKPSRVIYLNDSVYYLAGPALDDFTRKLAASPYDVVGALENHAHSHHLGSYALSLSGAAFADPKILRFWQRYRPYDLRPYVIKKGELRLSNTLRRCGYRFDTVYGAEKLADRLAAMSLAEIVDHMRYLPRHFQITGMVPALGSAASLASLFTDGDDDGGSNTRTPPAPRLPLGADARPEAALVKATLIDAIMRAVTTHSQIHEGFGLFHRLLDCPLVKKDLLQRDIFTEHQMVAILDRMPKDESATVLRELINRGRPTYVRGKARFMMDHGLI